MGNRDIEIEPLSNKDIMFGIMDCKRNLFVNHILLTAKKCIYSCRCNKTKPYIIVLNARIKTIYRLEVMVAKSCNKLPIHLEKWGKYIKINAMIAELRARGAPYLRKYGNPSM